MMPEASVPRRTCSRSYDPAGKTSGLRPSTTSYACLATPARSIPCGRTTEKPSTGGAPPTSTTITSSVGSAAGPSRSRDPRLKLGLSRSPPPTTLSTSDTPSRSPAPAPSARSYGPRNANRADRPVREGRHCRLVAARTVPAEVGTGTRPARRGLLEDGNEKERPPVAEGRDHPPGGGVVQPKHAGLPVKGAGILGESVGGLVGSTTGGRGC